MNYAELKERMRKQKVEMTPAERMKAYLEGEEVDFLPYNLLDCDNALADVYGFTTEQIRMDFDILAEIIDRKREDFGLEGLGVGLDLRTLGAALGSELQFPEHGIDHVKSYVLEDYKEFGKLDIPDPYNNEVLTPMFEQAKRLKDRFPEMTLETFVSGPFTAASAIRPVEKILRDTRKNPQELKRLLQFSVDGTIHWLEAFCREFGPVTTMICDPVTCLDILSKKQFKELSLPYLSHLIERISEITGEKPTMHICGRTKEIWDEIGDIGISLFSIDNCEDLEEAKNALGNKMILMGNVPPVEVMTNGTIDDVINSCKECIQKCTDSPNGYIPDTGCEVPIGTPKENIDAFVYAVRKYGRGAKKGQLPKGLSEE